MSYNLDLLPLEHILLGRWNEDFNFKEEAPRFDRAARGMLDQFSESVCFIIEFCGPQLTIPEIMIGTKAFTEGKAAFRHPKIKRLVVVTTSALDRLAAKGMNSAPFDFVEMDVFSTLGEALAFAHAYDSSGETYDTERIS